MSIIHAAARWILGVFAPGTGTRRAGTRPTGPAPARTGETLGPTAVPLPAHRSPYGLPVLLDGRDAALVRPYVIATERENARLRRRIGLVLAADFGIGLDHHLITAGGVA
ncbi:hypothetical protein [Streptomyces sediminimaris]|uniref:hypothetical protein n=1 Tax=Streptomyces sediminimaris TaxID=3383721 RepID=UPI003999A748